MSGQPQNPFANLPMPGQSELGRPSPGGGAGGGKPAAVTRFTPLTFSGTGLQLFGIQILNMFLTMLTLGLWTPWARVRKRRFFYSNTRILDEGLDYLATGFDIFKGWVIVTLIFAIYYVIPILLPVPFLEYLLVLVLLFVYPWALNRSFRFNARNIAWRDVRFDFNGSYLGSLWYFFILPLIGLLSVGLLMPLASKAMRDYVARCYSFGTANFSSDSSVLSYYGAGIKTLILSGILMVPLVAAVYLVIYDLAMQYVAGGLTAPSVEQIMEEPAIGAIFIMVPVGLYFLFTITVSYYQALTRNIMVNTLRLQGGIRFRSTLSGFVLAWIMLTNLILIVISLGLLLPWTQVRRYRYLTERTEIRPIGDLNGFLDRQVKAGSSIGDAVGEAGGLEITF